MDQRRFDRLARSLAAHSSRRSALAALAALASAMPALAAAPKDGPAARRRKCRRDSPPGQCCRKRNGATICTCRNGGAPCGPRCCATGETCRDGACVPPTPEPTPTPTPAPSPTPGPTCLAPGDPCEGTARRCCDGLVCTIGWSGSTPVVCASPAGGACTRNEDCVFGMACLSGVCARPPDPVPPAPVPTGAACNAGDRCADPAASCTTYISWAGGPDGTYCLLPFDAACGAASQCRGNACTAGSCGEICDVCDDCAHATLQSAVDAASSGGVIRIAAGFYPGASATVTDKSLTFRPCNTTTRPVLTAAANVADTASIFTLAVTTGTPRTVTLESLSLGGSAHPLTASGHSTSGGKLTLSIRDCEMACVSDTRIVNLAAGYIDATVEDSALTCVEILHVRNRETPTNRLTVSRSRFDGAYRTTVNPDHLGTFVQGGPALNVSSAIVTLEDTEITRCTNIAGGGFWSGGFNVVRLSGQTRISRCISTNWGGGGALFSEADQVEIEPTVRITKNSAPVSPVALGAGVHQLFPSQVFTGVTPTTVFDNYDLGTTTVTPANQCTVNGGASCMGS